MKAWLTKVTNIYTLLNFDYKMMASNDADMQKDYKIGKLSEENCHQMYKPVNLKEVLNPYDMFDEEAKKDPYLDYPNAKPIFVFGVKKGIEKAMEFNKDKVFTVKDVEKAIEYFVKNEFQLTEKNINSTIYSIQNPKYLEVEVLMKNSRTGKIIELESELEWDEDGICDKAIPELDENGCLILKKA